MGFEEELRRWKQGNYSRESLLILASASSKSINGKVLNACRAFLKNQGIEIDYLNLGEYKGRIPLLEDDHALPDETKEISEIISKYRYWIIFAPEYGGYFTAFFKNILEWLAVENMDFMKDKGIVVVSVSDTDKVKRWMEEGIENTVKLYQGKFFRFINYNKFSKERIGERNEWIASEILKSILKI